MLFRSKKRTHTSSEDRKRIYSPLRGNTIRIFELEPASKSSDVIRGRMIHVNLSDKPRYEAISYTWDDTAPRLVKVGGFDLFVTRSTVIALRKVRWPDRTRRVWIDALCINQKDGQEKGHQVQLMGSIYAQAKRVLVCMYSIGDTADNRLLNDIHTAFEPTHRIPHYPTPSRTFFLNKQHTFTKRLVGSDGKNLAAFLNNRWFKRVWVLQEVGLASSVHIYYNNWEISWEKVLFVRKFIDAQSWIIRSHLDIPAVIGYMRREYWTHNSNITFLKVLCDSRASHATDPRDKVFALLSHPSARLQETSDTLVHPDYTKTIEQVYLEVACSLMKGPRPLRVLAAAQHDTMIRKPSWIPRWNIRSAIVLCDLGPEKHHYRCAGGTAAKFEIRNEGRILTVRGLYFDVVEFRSQSMGLTYPLWTRKNRDVIASAWNHISESPEATQLYPTMEDARIAYLRTLTADYFFWFWRGRRDPLVPNNDLEASVSLLTEIFAREGMDYMLNFQWESADSEKINDAGKAVQFFYNQLAYACRGRRVFVSQKGFCGIGPNITEKGDVICIPFGSDVPLILRRDRGEWEMVGECYVHGIMNGEGIGMWEEGLIEEHEFHIN